MKKSYPKFILGDKLTAEQLYFFKENGFIHFKRFLNPHAVNTIIKASEEVQENWIANNVEKVNGVPIKYGQDIDGKKIVHRFAFINKQHAVLDELAKDPRLEIILDLLGEGARLGEDEKDGMVFNHFINTSNSSYSRLGWHTDSLRDIFYGKKVMPMLNVGIHLTTVPEHLGGLRILPGTHTQGLYGMLFRKKYFIDNEPDAGEVAINPEPGDLTIHDGRLWHRVAQSPVSGEESRRRVIYIPMIAGKYAPKDENSPTQLYQRFAGLLK